MANNSATLAPVETTEFSREMHDSFRQYGNFVNSGRSIPDVRDGMKPVHRRILWAMYSDRILPGRKQKAANCVGSAMKFHPHGDSAIYGTMVNMAHVPSEGEPFKSPMPLIEGQGSWGDLVNDAAAMRYPECSLHHNALVLMGDDPDVVDGSPEVRENAVDMVDNYDGRLEEPIVLPALWPAYLVNPTEGIGVGIATKTPSHNLTEVMNLAIHMVDSPNPRMDTIKSIMPGPDMACDADIFDSPDEDRNIESYYRMGIGSFVMRARTTIEEYPVSARKKGKRIVVDTLPFKVAPEHVVAGVTNMIDQELLPQDIVVTNLTDKNGIRVVIDVQENDPDDVLQRLLYHRSKSFLQQSFSVNSNALVDGKIRTIGIIEALSKWIEHRRVCTRRRTKFRLAKAEARIEIVNGFIKAIPIADKIVDLIRQCDDRKDAEQKLQLPEWGFTNNQASAILDMTLAQLTKLSVGRYQGEHQQLTDKIDECNDLLSNPRSLDNRLKKEMRSVRDQYGYERRCQIVEGSPVIAAPSTPAVQIPAKNGYLIRTANKWVRWATRSNVNRVHGTSYVTDLVPITDQNMVEGISSVGWHYRIGTDSLPERLTKSEALFAGIDPGEEIVMVASDAGRGSDIVMIAEDPDDEGRPQIKRVANDVWTRLGEGRNKAIFNQEGWKVTHAFFLPPGHDIGIITGYGAMLKIDPDDIAPKTRAARGMPAINPAGEGDSVIWAGPVAGDENIVYWTSAGTLGWFKASEVDYSRRNTRGQSITRSTRLIKDVRVTSEALGKLVYFDGQDTHDIPLEGQTAGANLSDRQLKIEDADLLKATAVWLEEA